MYIQDLKTGEKAMVFVEPVSGKDFRLIKKDTGFHFDWDAYKSKEVYKLYTRIEEPLLGLLCITDHTDEETNAIEIELLEVRSDQVGQKKRFDRIAGVLIAFACRESFRRGHEGYVFLRPKTELIKHYSSKYHLIYFNPVGQNLTGLLIAEEKISIRLIKEYLSQTGA